MLILDVLGSSDVIFLYESWRIQHYEGMIPNRHSLVEWSEVLGEPLARLARGSRVDVQSGKTQSLCVCAGLTEFGAHPTSLFPGTKYDGIRRSRRNMSENLL